MRLERSKKFLKFVIAFTFILWFIIFRSDLINFWFRLTFTILILMFFTLKNIKLNLNIKLKDLYVGVISALILYFIFWIGRELITLVFPFSSKNIAAVYKYRQDLNLIYISLLLIFIIGPGEEIFWRGFIQKELIDKFGKNKGYLITSLIYSGVHLWTSNFILVLAAVVAGLFWGYLTLRWKRLEPIIISHAIWDLLVFIVFPLG